MIFRRYLVILASVIALAVGHGAETPSITVAVSEGAATSNAIEILAQMDAPGIVVVSTPTEADISSDLCESSYGPLLHMNVVQLTEKTIVAAVAELNHQQTIAQFQHDGSAILVSIPRDHADVAACLALLDQPLGIGAGSVCDLNDDNTVALLEGALAKQAAKRQPALSPIVINVWSKGDAPFYLRNTKRPKFVPVTLTPDMTLRRIMLEQMAQMPNLIWIAHLKGQQLTISTTTTMPHRTGRTLPVVLADMKLSNSAVGDYPSVAARIHDASRELLRRLLIAPEATAMALVASSVLDDLVKALVPDDNDTSVHGHLYFLMCSRNSVVIKTIQSATAKAPKNISDEFYFSVLPGINGGVPQWKALFKPVWTDQLGNADPDIVARAKAMLVER